jgi:hypothetical protein
MQRHGIDGWQTHSGGKNALRGNKEAAMDKYKIVPGGPHSCKIVHCISNRTIATFTRYEDAQEFKLAANTFGTLVASRDQLKAQVNQLLVACQRLLDFVDGTGEDSEEYEEYADTIDQIREAVKECGVEE